MKQYFSANQLHLEDRCMVDGAPRASLIATYGLDNLIFTIDPLTGNKNQYQLMQRDTYSAMTLAADGSHCLFASGSSIVKYDFEPRAIDTLAEKVGNGDIKVLKYAQSGNFVAVGAEDGKPVILEPRTGRKEKCRPGHSRAVTNIFLSRDEEFLGSIANDQYALIYRLSPVEQPQQVARFQITHIEDCSSLSGSFHFSKSIAYLPGERFLQTFQLLDGRWQMLRLQTISHGANIILLTQIVNEHTLVTSSDKEVCIWNIRSQEKLFQIQDFSLNSVVPLAGTFFGMRNDGKLYNYLRDMRQREPMEIEEEKPEDRIEFEQVESSQGQQQSIAKRSEVQFQVQKKSKADKIITCLPQAPLTSATTIFDGQRFLFTNEHGCIIERLEANQQKVIEAQFGLENPKKMIIARGKEMIHFDLNPFALVYATDKEFGVKIHPGSGFEGESCQRTWNNIKAIATGAGWLAVANEQQIKIFDMCCHEIKTIAFDREIIALRAHENMLCVVYHQSIPLWGSQQLAMQLFLVDTIMSNANMISTVPVPVRPQSILRSIHFSQEGMLISQDSSGALRAFSLQRGDWTPIGLVELQDSRKAWIVGVTNYEILFWKTSNEDPQPTVAPRFAINRSCIYIPTVGAHPGETQSTYEELLWARFALDHEKSRVRLWGRLKTSRLQGSSYYYLVASIVSEKEIAVRHEQLDEKFFNLVQSYLKCNEALRALYLAKTCIRSIQSLRKLVELFDYFNKRNLAIQLQEFCEERQRQLEYEQMQIFQFMKMREAAEKTIKPRSEDPMRRTNKRITESIPSFSQNMSQESIDPLSSVGKINGSQVSQQSKATVNSQPVEEQNPFLRRKSTNEQFQAKKKEIFEHVQKFGIKKKVQDKNIHKRNKV